MKSLIAFALVTLSANSFASFYQISCSSPDASVQYFTGHVKNKLVVTERVYGGKEVKKELKDFKIETLNEKVLEMERTSSCRPGDTGGVGSSTTISYRKVKITRLDESELPDGTVGVSKDKKSLTVSYLCEMYMNSRMPCN